jgi:hypothetical protein
MNNWLHRYTRLNELFEKIKLERIKFQKSDNFIAGYIERGNRDPLVQKDAELIEANLSQLDSNAWKDLVEKVLRNSCSKRGSIEREQFWDHLNEVRGYLLLAERGYSEIDFIPETDEERADLVGKFPKRVILEVKTINRSDDDIERDRKRNNPTFLATKKVRGHERRGDIIDLFAFAKKLRQKSDPVSTFLWEQLDKPTQELLDNYVSDTEQLESKLVQNLNRIIQGSCIYEIERFRGIHLRVITEDLLDSQETCHVCCLNRCLLDDKYRQELSSWWESVGHFVAAPTSDVPAPIPDKLLKKCEKRIEKARSQIETTLKSIPPVEKKIVLLIVNRDFGCSLIAMQQLEEKLRKPDLEVVCQLGDCY